MAALRPGGRQIAKAAPSRAAPAVSAGSIGAFTEGQRGPAIYGALAGAFLAAGFVKAVAPGAALELVYNACGDSACQAFMRLSGLLCVLPGSALYCLKGAAEHGRLGSGTYERLNMALLVSGLGCSALAASAALGPGLATSGAAWGVAALGAVMAAACGHVLTNGEAGVAAVAARVRSEALLVAKPANATAAMYSGLTVATAAMALGLVLFPGQVHTILFNEASSAGTLMLHIKRSIGMLLLTASAVAYTLKDAADRSRLGASTFKLLNLSFSVCTAGTLGTMLGYVHNSANAQFTSSAAGMLAVLAAGTVVCSYQYATAEK